jgi:hypothetical protein
LSVELHQGAQPTLSRLIYRQLVIASIQQRPTVSSSIHTLGGPAEIVMASHHVIREWRSIVNTYVSVIGYGLKWNSTVPALVARGGNETYGTIVDLFDMVPAWHISRILLSTHR